MVQVTEISATTDKPGQDARRTWMAVLARSTTAELEAGWAALPLRPAYRLLRPAESGLTMIRARAGGDGSSFNLGEASITRCTLKTDTGHTGVAYVLGRDRRHAELAAAFDALMQDPRTRKSVQEGIVAKIARRLAAECDTRSRKSASTRVDFYTLVRGENP
jgi:alpha-D-ribose 1-methylphosphonate 5-triphosphate synthase subunit PhnG